MMAPRQLLLIVLAFLAISEISTSSSNDTDIEDKCQGLPTLSYGRVTRIGCDKDQINYVCNPGYKLAVTADCLRGNSWTPRVTCKEILCEDEPIIVNGSLDGDIDSRSIGAEYNFTCDSGIGKVVCNERGKWDVGECEAKECIYIEGSKISIKREYLQDIRTESQCLEACDNDTACGTVIMSDDCTLLFKPVIGYFKDRVECSTVCITNSACKLVYIIQEFGGIEVCYQFNTDDIASLSVTKDEEAKSIIMNKNCS